MNWVRNVRAAGQISLRRGQLTQRLHAKEVTPVQAVPVIRAYIDQVPVTHGYWEVTSQSTDAEVTASAARHPVFHLNPAD